VYSYWHKSQVFFIIIQLLRAKATLRFALIIINTFANFEITLPDRHIWWFCDNFHPHI